MYLPEKFERKMQDILGDEYQQIANESIQNQMKENSEIYWDDFEGIQEDTPFYLNESGNPVIVFEKYEIAPGSEGQQEFEIKR